MSRGASFAFASAVVTALPTILIAAASITASAVLADRQRDTFKSSSTPVNNDIGLQQNVPNAAPEHLLALGYATTAGRTIFRAGGIENRPYYWLGLVLAAHKTDGLESIELGNTTIIIDPATGNATSSPFNDGVISFIEVSYRNGDINQEIDPIIARDFPEMISTFRHRGHTTLFLKVHFGDGASSSTARGKT